MNVADRDHFRIQLDPTQDALVISKPVRGRISDQWTVQYTRKLLTADGKLAGVAAISVGCNDLSRFYETLDIGNGFGPLAGLDGAVRALGPARQDALGTDLSRDPGFAAALDAAGGSFSAVTPWDGVERIISFRRLRNYPLVVLVGYDAERTYREYRSIRNRSDVIGAAASLIILSLGGVWIQQRLRSAASRRALLFTLGSMSQGIAMVDNAGRVPVVNRRFVELLDLPRSLLIPGRRPLKAELNLLVRAGLAEPLRARGDAPGIALRWPDHRSHIPAPAQWRADPYADRRDGSTHRGGAHLPPRAPRFTNRPGQSRFAQQTAGGDVERSCA